MRNHSYNFDDQMQMSEGIGREEDTGTFILSRFPNAVNVERASQSDDRHGTDYWITMKSGEIESLDLKARKKDYSANNPKKDDLALEVWSVLDKKVGWTRDTEKRTNWIMWKWDDTKRYMLMPFPWLCSVFEIKWPEWITQYHAPIQDTVDKWGRLRWQSQCVFVPRQVLWDEMLSAYGGVPTRQVNPHISPTSGLKRAEQGYSHRGQPLTQRERDIINEVVDVLRYRGEEGDE